ARAGPGFDRSPQKRAGRRVGKAAAGRSVWRGINPNDSGSCRGSGLMGRSLKKGPYVVERLLEKVYRADNTGSREPIRTWARACTIVPEFIGKNFAIHNGKTFIKLFVTEDMVGHKLGEFAPTRTFRGHGGKAAKSGARK